MAFLRKDNDAGGPVGLGRGFLIVGAALALAISLALSVSEPGRRLEATAYDLAARLLDRAPPPGQIILIGLDEVSLDLMADLDNGLKWPYPRATHAKVLDNLARVGVKSAVVDIIFDLPSGHGVEDDLALAGAIGNLPTVLAAELTPGSYIAPLELFIEAGAKVGDATLPLDPDGAVRAMPGAYWPRKGADWLAYCLGLGRPVATEAATPAMAGAAYEVIRGRKAPAPGLIRYRGPAGTFPTISYFEAFQPELLADYAEELNGKTVLVGRTLSASLTPGGRADVYVTPAGGGMTAGVEIQANALANLLTGRSLHLAPSPLFALGLLIYCGLIVAGLTAIRSPWGQLGLSVAALVGLAGGVGAARSAGLVVPIIPAALFTALFQVLALGRRYLNERDARMLVKGQLFHYLPARVAEHVLKNPMGLAMAADRTEVTVLFADLAGFTSISEREPAEIVLPLLQDHLGQMTEVIFNSGGTLDKYLGDGIMAFWGAPEPQADQADRALAASGRMVARLKEANTHRRQEGTPELKLRIGLHTGPAIAGNIGSKLFIDYTVIGDTVNTAARLESAGKQFGLGLLISQNLIESLTGPRPGNLYPVGRVTVVGKEEPIELFTLARSDQVPAFEQLALALAELDQGRTDQAQARLKDAAAATPDFGPAAFHLARLGKGRPLVDQSGRAYWKLDSK